MTLKVKFVKSKPRERSGATASSRFNYQKDWSLCKLLEKQKSGDDYLLLFDYHEDLVIVDSESNPTKVSFFQIKGDKTKNWTTDRLTKSSVGKKGKPLLSIIGKLYNCKCEFELETMSLNFVSNARFNVKLKNDSKGLSKDKISFSELHDDELKKIEERLKVELSITNPEIENIAYLEVISLNLSESSTHVKGFLTDFFDQIKPNHGISITAFYNHLFNEIKMLSDYDKDLSTYEELLEKKGISKSKFDKWISEVLVETKNYEEIWKRLEIQLNSANVDFSTQRKLKSALIDYEIRIKDPNNDILKRISKEVKRMFNELDNNGAFIGKNYVECLEIVLIKYLEKPIKTSIFNEIDLKAIIIAQTYE